MKKFPIFIALFVLGCQQTPENKSTGIDQKKGTAFSEEQQDPYAQEWQNILYKVGQVPVIAIGNSPGDYPMLQYSKNSRKSLQMILNHDDSLREYVYDYEKMKKLCEENGWLEISIKNDFKE